MTERETQPGDTEYRTVELDGETLVTLGDLDYADGKAPTQSFGGWPSGEASGRNADWDHEGTWAVSGRAVHELRGELEARGRTAFLLDHDGVNLGVADFDVVDDPDDADIAAGKWPDKEALRERLEDWLPGCFPIWSTPNGYQVPFALTDEAHEAAWENELKAGYGVEKLKGPSFKGYTAAPLSPGYGVERSAGGVPLVGLDELEGLGLAARKQQRGGEVDPADFEPSVPASVAHETEETGDMGVLLSAINRLGPGDFAHGCDIASERDDGTVHFDPSYRHSSSGSSLTFWPEKHIWYDVGEEVGFFSDKLVALEEGIVESPHDELSGADWWEAVDALRDRGAPVPEWTGPEPEWMIDLEATPGLAESEGDEALLWDVRRDYAEQHAAAVREGVSGHLVGPKGCGKTHNIIETAKEHKTAAFLPTKQKYRELAALAETMGVSHLRLPSFPEHSAIYEDWESEYHRGARPRELYSWDDREVEDDYLELQAEDLERYDLLIGAPVHAHLESVVKDRVVFFDDAELSAFRDPLDRETMDQINRVLERIDDGPGNWRRLAGADWSRIEAALVRELRGAAVGDGDVWEALEDATESGDSIDRRAFLAELPGVSLDVVDWMRALTGELRKSDAYEDRGMRLVYVDRDNCMLVRAPDLSEAEQVFSMGAWPSLPTLEAAFEDMNVEFEGVFGSARHDDMERALNRHVIQTSGHVHNKSSRSDPEFVERLARAAELLGDELGIDESAKVFTTKSEADELEGAVNYGSLVGTNEHADYHLGVVGGSQHFGEDYVKREAAYAGATPAEPVEGGAYEPRRWDEPTHAFIERRMRMSGAYEAMTRLGRNDVRRTIILADTCEIPPWAQVTDQSSKVDKVTESAQKLYEYIKESDGPAYIKDGEGGGAAVDLDYSGTALYTALDELVSEGLIEAVESGKYNAQGYEEVEDNQLTEIKGLKGYRLAGSEFSPAEKPQWDVVRFPVDADEARETSQVPLDGVNWAD